MHMSEAGEIPISELKSQVAAAQNGEIESLQGDEEAMRPLVDQIKACAFEFAQAHDAEPWLLDTIKSGQDLDGIVAYMRHIREGQVFVLRELQKIKPDLEWNRGGTLLKWADAIGSHNDPFFTAEQLDTYIIDGGKNGALGRPSLALSFLEHTPRSNPVFYTLTLDDLIEGLQSNAISLGTEHYYDLTVNEGTNRPAYLDFCRNNLKIQRVAVDQTIVEGKK